MTIHYFKSNYISCTNYSRYTKWNSETQVVIRYHLRPLSRLITSGARVAPINVEWFLEKSKWIEISEDTFNSECLRKFVEQELAK